MLDIFRNGVLTKSSISNIETNLSTFIKGTEKSPGILDRYVKQVYSDSITQFTANYTQIISEDQGYEFYKYVGNRSKDTRCFCAQRYNKFFHKKEIENWGNGKVMDGVEGENCGYPWAGMIKGTDSSSIFTYRGGWFCNHQIIPILTKRVPADVIQRAKGKGYYKE